MDQISINLDDKMTLGTLRAIARGTGKRLVVSFEDAEKAPRNGRGKRGRGRPAAAMLAPTRRKRRRRLSPEVRAKLARNLAKARAVRLANIKAATASRGKRAKATTPKEASA